MRARSVLERLATSTLLADAMVYAAEALCDQ
jgi:hypothetical protein